VLVSRTALVWDRGLYVFLAQKLGETFDKVWYYFPQSEPYPTSPTSQIGVGLPEIERVYEFWPYVDKADCIVFFDCYDGELQHWLREKGYRVFGSMRSEKVEMDKVFFYQYLVDHGMQIPNTYRAEGLDDLVEHLKGKKPDKWLKTSYYRGDFETHHYTGMKHLRPFLDDLRRRIGKKCDEIEILVQDSITSKCEVGYDGFCCDGEFTKNGVVGYEIKDRGLVSKIFRDTPEVLQNVNDAFTPLFKKMGYRGHWSTEIRITESGRSYFIDPTCRAPSPPSELLCEQYENYAEVVWSLSGGETPYPTSRARFGAEIILKSPWHEDHELYVEFPKELSGNVKLKNHMKDGNGYTCIPNKNGGFFGAVVAYGSTVKEVTQKCLDYAKEVKALELDYDDTVFDKASEVIKSGEEFGIEF
jgi:hypothetical protein